VLACVFVLTRYQPVELPPDFNSVRVCVEGGGVCECVYVFVREYVCWRVCLY